MLTHVITQMLTPRHMLHTRAARQHARAARKRVKVVKVGVILRSVAALSRAQVQPRAA